MKNILKDRMGAFASPNNLFADPRLTGNGPSLPDLQSDSKRVIPPFSLRGDAMGGD